MWLKNTQMQVQPLQKIYVILTVLISNTAAHANVISHAGKSYSLHILSVCLT